MIASALRRRVWLDQGHFIYTPNQYFVLVAPPGKIAKSTTIGVASKLLRELPEITFGPDSSTWQAFFEKLVQSQREEIFGDPTDLNSIRQISAPLTLAISEFGSFLNMDEDQLVNLLINFWDGQTGVFNRTTRKDGSIDVINPLVNLIGCTTDAWMHENFKAHLLEGGLGSRVLFVHQENKRKLVAYPHLVHDATRHDALRRRLINDLEIIAGLHGELRLDKEALAFGEAFYRVHNSTAPRATYFDGYHARKFVHMHKLAMLFSVAESSDMIVSVEHLRRALSFLELIEEGIAQTTQIVKSSGSVQGERITRVRQTIKGHKTITLKRLSHLLVSMLNGKEIDQALNDLVRAGEIEMIREKAGKVTLKWLTEDK